MSDIIQQVVSEQLKVAGFIKKANSWYHYADEIVAVVNLQRSQWGPQYYVNVGFWLNALGDQRTPPENKCHIRSRLELLFNEGEIKIETLLDLNSQMEAEERAARLISLLSRCLVPMLNAIRSIDDLRTSKAGVALLSESLVTGPAQALIRRSTE